MSTVIKAICIDISVHLRRESLFTAKIRLVTGREIKNNIIRFNKDLFIIDFGL
jgi:hypothetical protein